MNTALNHCNPDNFADFVFKDADKKGASYDSSSGNFTIKFEVSGTMYEGRSQRIENIAAGDAVNIMCDFTNPHNDNNIAVYDKSGGSLGNFPEELCNVLGPLIKKGHVVLGRASATYVEPLSRRGDKAKKSILFIEMNGKLKKVKCTAENGCIFCLLGGDQIRTWAQQLTVMTCSIPLECEKLFFELYNRMSDEYNKTENDDVSYAGLYSLDTEIRCARRKMNMDKKADLDYSDAYQADGFYSYIKAAISAEPQRHGSLEQYINKFSSEDEYLELTDIFANFIIDKEVFYWLDQTRVTTDEYDIDNCCGFNHWYEIAELYAVNGLPFDLSDKEIVSIFGFDKFEAFADLSCGC